MIARTGQAFLPLLTGVGRGPIIGVVPLPNSLMHTDGLRVETSLQRLAGARAGAANR